MDGAYDKISRRPGGEGDKYYNNIGQQHAGKGYGVKQPVIGGRDNAPQGQQATDADLDNFIEIADDGDLPF